MRRLTFTKKKYYVTLMIGFIFFLACFIAGPLSGSTDIDAIQLFQDILKGDISTDFIIVFYSRLPRTILAALAGLTLASSGAAFQGLLRNPLADPYTLGVASGAACGAVLCIVTGISESFGGAPIIEITSFCFAMATVTVVLVLSKRNGRISTLLTLLSGVAISFFFSAIILFLQFIADFTQTYRLTHWMMGSLDITGYREIVHIAALITIPTIVLMLLSKHLNILAAGDDSAMAKGVNVERVRVIALIAASLSTSAIVSITGPIGFVGLVIPHSLRLMIGSDYRIVLPASAICGGGFLILCDIISRTILAPTELPIGVLTAILGGPFFLSILFRLRTASS